MPVQSPEKEAMELKSSDQFIETVELNGKIHSKREGTLSELVKLETAAKPTLSAPAAGASTGELAFEVAKFAWDIVKDSKAELDTQGAYTRVLCKKDGNWQNYAGARNFQSEELTYKLDNFAGVNCYTLKFKVSGTCAATNRSFGGHWIPDAHVTFDECSATWPWVVNGKATVDKNISNVGTTDDPIPQAVITIKFHTKAKVAFEWETHQKTFEFRLNGKTGVTRV